MHAYIHACKPITVTNIDVHQRTGRFPHHTHFLAPKTAAALECAVGCVVLTYLVMTWWVVVVVWCAGASA